MEPVRGFVVNEVGSRLCEVPNVVVGAPLRLAMHTISTLGGILGALCSCLTLGRDPFLNRYADLISFSSPLLLTDFYESLLYLVNPAAGKRLTNHFAQQLILYKLFDRISADKITKKDFSVNLKWFELPSQSIGEERNLLDQRLSSLSSRLLADIPNSCHCPDEGWSIDDWQAWVKNYVPVDAMDGVDRALVLDTISGSTWLASMTSEAFFKLGVKYGNSHLHEPARDTATWKERVIVVLNNQVASRLAFVASAVATVIVTPLDLLIGIAVAGASLLPLCGASDRVNRFAIIQLAACGAIGGLCAALRHAVNPYQA